jgi:MoxR-like ATPase
MDRFMMRLSVGYPSEGAELAMLEAQSGGTHPVEAVEAVVAPEDLIVLQDAVTGVEVHPDVARYIVRLVQASRHHAGVVLGASPRGSLALRRAAQALAFLANQSFVTPQLVRQVAVPVLAHRIVLRNGGNALQATEAFVRKLLDEVPVPVGFEATTAAVPA